MRTCPFYPFPILDTAADVALLASDVRAEASPARFIAAFGPVARAPLADAIRRFAAAPAGEAAA